MRAQFVLSEIGTGLRRNLTMTMAVVVTVAISLALFGAGLLIRSQVDVMKDYWYDRVEVSVFLCGGGNEGTPPCYGRAVSPEERAQLQAHLEATPQVARVYYESKDEAFARFQDQFKGDYFKSWAGLSISAGILIATVMFLNVWLVIWPNQKIVIANADRVAGGQAPDPAAAPAARKAAFRRAIMVGRSATCGTQVT